MIKSSLLVMLLLIGFTSCTKDPIVTEADTTEVNKPEPPKPPGGGNGGGTPPPSGNMNIPKHLQEYYAGVDFSKSGTALKKELQTNLERRHAKKLSYTPDVWEAIKATDYVVVNSGSPTHVYLVYGHDNKADSKDEEAYIRAMSKQHKGGSEVDTWNREHVYTQSAGDFDTSPGIGTDVYNIRGADTKWNGKRGNKKFTEGKGYSAMVGGDLWYPGDEWKGDVARMAMYMYVRYGEKCLPSKIGVGSTAETPDGMIDLFLKWHKEDPVSEIERKRNEYHGNAKNKYGQGNRNPFVDNPYIANLLWKGPEVENTWK